jgi:biopolymer transport protein ExbD
MAGVDVGSPGGGKRALNSDINMIPFIDLLMVTIAFLLITAVWSSHSRINADAQVPGPPGPDVDVKVQKTLHVHVGESDFGLTWRQEGTVVSELKIPRHPSMVDETARYPELAKAVEKEWKTQGSHVDPMDRKADQAVLHSDDKLPFRELVAVLDALNAPKREVRFADGKTARVPAFNTTFSVR